MIDLHLKFFKLTIDLHIDCKCDKHKVNSEESDTKVIETPRNKSENLYDENINDNQNAEEILPTPIELQASLLFLVEEAILIQFQGKQSYSLNILK